MNRLIYILKAKFSKLLERVEDPLETLDYAYEQQLQQLRNVNRGLTEAVTAKKRLEIQAKNLGGQIEKLEGQARAALSANREDLARVALERKAGLEAQKQSLDLQVEDLEEKQAKLVQSQQLFKQKIEAFRNEKETIKANYRAGEAMVAIGEATAGLGSSLTDTGRSIQRAKDKTDQMQARAAAIGELVDSGALTEISGESNLDRELRQLASASQVDSELASLRAELGQDELAEPPKALSNNDELPVAAAAPFRQPESEQSHEL